MAVACRVSVRRNVGGVSGRAMCMRKRERRHCRRTDATIVFEGRQLEYCLARGANVTCIGALLPNDMARACEYSFASQSQLSDCVDGRRGVALRFQSGPRGSGTSDQCTDIDPMPV